MALILYFGRLTDALGKSEERLDLPPGVTTTSALRQWLDETSGGAGHLLDESVRIALNDEIVSEPAPVSERDEIAFLPPVGGG